MNGLETLAAALSALPPQTDATYASKARGVLNLPDAGQSQLQSIATSDKFAPEVRFNAFYCMQALEWRLKNHSQYRENLDLFQSLFAEQPMLDFMQAEYYTAGEHGVSSLETALIFARQAYKKLPAVPGVLNLFAELVCRYVERTAIVDQELLAEADRCSARSIALDRNYPKYYATRSTVSMLRGDFDGALGLISTAIDREDSTGPHYALRIADYQLVRSRIIYKMEYREIKVAQEQSMRDFREMRAQVFEIMGILAAVIAFIASVSNIGSTSDPLRAIPMMLVVGALLVTVFWSFHFLFVGVDDRLRAIIPLAVALILGTAGCVWALLS